MNAPARTIRLGDIEAGSILHRIAVAMIARKGEYLCVVNGEKVKVIA